MESGEGAGESGHVIARGSSAGAKNMMIKNYDQKFIPAFDQTMHLSRKKLKNYTSPDYIFNFYKNIERFSKFSCRNTLNINAIF